MLEFDPTSDDTVTLPVAHVDYRIEAGEDAAAFAPEPDNAPAPGYLPLALGARPPVLAGLRGPRVGLVWAGDPGHEHDRFRSMPFAALQRLVQATPWVSWVSCYVGWRAPELCATPELRRVRDAGATFGSLLDTAQLMQHLDLVVSVDSSPAHLAGALGRPVWTLLGPFLDFRWGLETGDTPLYRSMRLLRDAERGDWRAAVDRVVRELGAWQSTGDLR